MENEAEELKAELPLDGLTVETHRGKWTIRVRKLGLLAAHNTMRIAELTLLGQPNYDLTLEIPGEILVVEHRKGDIQWVLNGIRDWLVNPDPKSDKNTLNFE